MTNFRTSPYSAPPIILNVRTCDMCSTPFQPVTSRQKRCSKKCNSIASNTRKRKNFGLKLCRTCRQDLPIEKYEPAHRSCRDCEALFASGLKQCRGCDQVKPHAEYNRRGASSRPDPYDSRCKKCRSEYAKDRHSRSEIKQRSRTQKYLLRYGATVEQVEEMRLRQEGRCAICHVLMGDKYNVDHDHMTGAARDLLCVHCNWLLGHSFDSPDILRAAIAYLERHTNDSHMGP